MKQKVWGWSRSLVISLSLPWSCHPSFLPPAAVHTVPSFWNAFLLHICCKLLKTPPWGSLLTCVLSALPSSMNQRPHISTHCIRPVPSCPCKGLTTLSSTEAAWFPIWRLLPGLWPLARVSVWVQLGERNHTVIWMEKFNMFNHYP